jgi:ligand-binding SRPBCC domain-containing protein
MHQLRATQFVPLTLDQAWAFFSDPRNLAVITPADMGFVVKTDLPSKMYPGLMVEYTVRPLLKIPVKWVTEITHVRDREYFVDEQRTGPYRMWHHEHHFAAVPGGVEMHDIVSYELPFGPIGSLVNRLVVRKRVAHIFEYRREVLEDRFGKMPPPSVEAED